MNSVTEILDQLWQEPGVPEDDGAYLVPVGELLAAHEPRCLWLMTAAGTVVASRRLCPDAGGEAIGDLARRLAQGLGQRDFHAERAPLEGDRCQMFGLRLEPVVDSPVLGGVLPELDGSAESVARLAPSLRAGARVAWLGVQREREMAALRARVQQLRAEQDTLKAAHTEAIVHAIEEQQQRLSEEQSRMAAEQMCAANEAANRAKSEFLANMSHEIRTPLTAILGFCELLRNGSAQCDEAERKEYLDVIYGSANHLLELINDVLDLSKIEAGRMEIDRIACSPYEVVSGVLSLMRIRAQEKGLWLTCEWPGGVPEMIRTDPMRLRQLLVNLVGNAVKFTHRGGVRLVCRLLRSGTKPQIAFDVVDTGIGIAPEKLEAIFDAFVQADTSVTREFGGTGLGLCISRRIARALGGEIAVQSRIGEGSTFTVTIGTGPLEGVSILERPQSDATLQAPRRDPSEPLPAARVLLVEDGSTNRKLISLVLNRAGLEVTTAENGQVGVELARAGSFDVILMDMQMPVKDGYTATAELRELGLVTPIIALTAHAMSSDEQKCLRAGCSAYLSKPVKPEQLLRTIAGALASTGDPVDRRDGPGGGCSDSAAATRAAGTAVLEPADDSPLVSSLPTEDPDFREIVEDFVCFLGEKMAAAEQAAREGDLETLGRVAHAIKGTAGGAGFDAFTKPAEILENHARAGRREAVAPALATLACLARRVVAPGNATLDGGRPSRAGVSW